jgi:uroporphyrinogen-III synthase
MENSAVELAKHIIRMNDIKQLTYFCGDLKQGDFTSMLAEKNIVVDEVEAYRTILNERKFEDTFDGILFYSPSGVQSYIDNNTDTNAIAFCIGETTATEAKKHFEKVEVSKLPSIENVIKLVNQHFE